jgi:hypothetical protein
MQELSKRVAEKITLNSMFKRKLQLLVGNYKYFIQNLGLMGHI